MHEESTPETKGRAARRRKDVSVERRVIKARLKKGKKGEKRWEGYRKRRRREIWLVDSACVSRLMDVIFSSEAPLPIPGPSLSLPPWLGPWQGYSRGREFRKIIGRSGLIMATPVKNKPLIGARAVQWVLKVKCESIHYFPGSLALSQPWRNGTQASMATWPRPFELTFHQHMSCSSNEPGKDHYGRHLANG